MLFYALSAYPFGKLWDDLSHASLLAWEPAILIGADFADTAPMELQGTAYGFFNLVSGMAMLAASVLACLPWIASAHLRRSSQGPHSAASH
jgi:hypothetical protein